MSSETPISNNLVNDANLLGSRAASLAREEYRRNLQRLISTILVLRIGFSMVDFVPSYSSINQADYDSSLAGFAWGWLQSALFFACTVKSLEIFNIAITTSGRPHYYKVNRAPARKRTSLSLLVGCANAIGLCGSICSTAHSFAIEMLSTVVVSYDGDFEVTDAKVYTVFAACVVLTGAIGCLTRRKVPWIHLSILVNLLIIVLVVLAVSVGTHRSFGFNDSHHIFAGLMAYRGWLQGWSFMFSWMPVWTIGASVICIHYPEEPREPQRSSLVLPAVVCWIVGWLVCIVCCAVNRDEDTSRRVTFDTCTVVTQFLLDALGKSWAIAFMLFIAVNQFFMSSYIMIAALRHLCELARDDGLPVVCNYIKHGLNVPVRSIIFTGVSSIIIGLLVLVRGSASASTLFAWCIASNIISWSIPHYLNWPPDVRDGLIAGPIDLSRSNGWLHHVSIIWLGYALRISFLRDKNAADKDTLNSIVFINLVAWIVCAVSFIVNWDSTHSESKPSVDKFELESKGEEEGKGGTQDRKLEIPSTKKSSSVEFSI